MSKSVNARGMWGLMAFPSSSTAAGAVPAFRAASKSFCLRNSSRDSFPSPTSKVRGVSLTTGQFHLPGPEAMMARVKDRLTKPGSMIVLKFRHVFRPKRVLTAILHHHLMLDGHTYRSSTYRRTRRRHEPAAGSTKVFTPSPPTYGYVTALRGHATRLTAARCPIVIFT